MKNIILLAASIIAFNSQAICTLDLGIKKPTAKTYYLSNGERLSQTMVNRLKSVCKINTHIMSAKVVRELKIKELTLKLAKAKAGK